MTQDQTPQAGKMADADERAQSQADGADKRADGFTRMLLVADVRQQDGNPVFETRRMAIATAADVSELDPTWMPDQQHQAWFDAVQVAANTAHGFTSVCGWPIRDEETPDALILRPLVLDWARKMEACLRRNEGPPKNKGPWLASEFRSLRLIRRELDEADRAHVCLVWIDHGDESDKVKAARAHLVDELVDVATTAMIAADCARADGPSKDRGYTL